MTEAEHFMTTTMSNQSRIEPQQALTWLRDQHALYQRLDALSERQQRLVEEDDPGALLSVLAARQSLTSDLMTIARRLAPVRREWVRLREAMTASQRSEADRLVEAAAATLSCVMRRDEEDARRLSARKVQASDGARQAAAAQQTLGRLAGAYAMPGSAGPEWGVA